MSVLEVSDLRFGFSNEPLFTKVSFRLDLGERAGLVAPNGAGKSTLLRVLAGELAPDQGSALVKKPATLGYYRQSHETRAQGSVLDALMSGFTELVAIRRALRKAEENAASGSAAALEELSSVLDRYQQAGADRLEQRVESIATRLGFRKSELAREVSTLSGGERGRLALGVVLATEPDVLLLDEPTNHLDLESIRWLEQHLRDQRGALLVVSHDRAFLDATCPITMELGRSSFRVYPLPYTLYHQERAEDLERERKQAEEQAAFVAKTEDFIRKNIAGQKTKQAQSRRKMLDKLDRVERPEDVWARAERIRFRFAETPRSGDIVLEAKQLSAARGGDQLFFGVDLLVRRGDRIAIVGPNGTGKSTLLKLLAGRGAPEDSGDVKRGTNLKEGYFDQHLGSLDPSRTGVEEIRSVRGDLNSDGARQYLARFRFYGDDPLRKVQSLSGGESTRLALAKLLLEPRNLLFLDEPTNHLDIPAAEILEEALVGFEGTVIFVSHDRRFLENVSTRTVAFTDAGVGQSGRSPAAANVVDVYEGGFADYTAMLARARAPRNEPVAKPSKAPKAAPPVATNKNAEQQRNKQRELERQRRRVGELEAQIKTAEQELQRQREALRDEASGNWEKLHNLALQEREQSARLERLTKEWVELSERLEASAPRS